MVSAAAAGVSRSAGPSDTQERTQREADRVRRNTKPEINERIDRESEANLARAASQGPAAIQARLEELDREWDVERYLEANAATFAFAGVTLGAFHSPWWLLLPAVVTLFLFQHAVQGWCPPLAIFRRRRVRTRKEIDQEKYALKALRGDFAGVGAAAGQDPAAVPAASALRAATT